MQKRLGLRPFMTLEKLPQFLPAKVMNHASR